MNQQFTAQQLRMQMQQPYALPEPLNPCKDQNQHAYQIVSYPEPGTRSAENPMGDSKMLAFCMRCGDRQDIP